MDCCTIFCVIGLFVLLAILSPLPIGIVGWVIDRVDGLLEKPNLTSDDDDDDDDIDDYEVWNSY